MDATAFSSMVATLGTSLPSTTYGGHESFERIQGGRLTAAPHICNGSEVLRARFKTPNREALFGGYGMKEHSNLLSGKVLRKSSRTPRVRSQVGTGQEVVIVGGGIAGLSAAVALHRVGVKTLVLEQSSSLRASGASLSLWGNAWRALESLGVAEGLRKEHSLATSINLFDRNQKLLRAFDFSECPGGPHEVRGVVRKLLVEALASQLPSGTIQFNSRVLAIERKSQDIYTKVKLENGSVISTKVLVGCDGVNSVVGKWLGLPPTRYVGQVGIRGVAVYPNGHDIGSKVVQYLGDGERTGLFPLSLTKVYWFILLNRPLGPKVTDPTLVKAEALELVKNGWPEKMTELVSNTPIETISRAPLSDRWNIPGITPSVVKEGVTLAGDALHPMTPSLGQGGCTAIEDAIILAKTLGVALSQQGGADAESIQRALEEYAAERQRRTFPITVKSFVFGFLLGISFGPVLFVRNNFAIPNISSQTFLSHSLYDAGRLPDSEVIVK